MLYFLKTEHRLQTHAAVVNEWIFKRKQPKSFDRSLVLPTAMKAVLQLPTQKNIARIDYVHVTHELHQENFGGIRRT